MSPASLLVAALVMLRHPCARSLGTAVLLLERAARDTALSADERETCLSLVDELEREERATPRIGAHTASACPTACP